MATLSADTQLDPALTPAPAAATAPPAVHPPTTAEVCASCGSPMPGEWCGACGERRLAPDHFAVRNFVRELRDEVLDLDGRALRSFRLLVTRPGLLTLEALNGRRRGYLGAFKMYLAVFALVMLLTPLLGVDDPRRAKQADALTAMFNSLVHTIAARRGITDTAAQQALMQTGLQHEGWLALIIPLLFAATLWVIFRRRRRYFGEHLLFAAHFATFNYLVGVVAMVAQPAASALGTAGVMLVALATMAVMVVYITAAVRRVYDTGRGASVAWGFVLLFAFSLAQTAVAVLAFGSAVARLLYL